MSNPHVFDELSSRLNRIKNQSDSNIHSNLLHPNNAEKNSSLNDLTSSNQQLNENVELKKKAAKKKGIVKSLKNIFTKKKKGKTNHTGELNIDSEVKREDALSNGKNKTQKENESALKDESPGKKNSLEKTQQKIRSSLRKFKNRNQKLDNEESPEAISSSEAFAFNIEPNSQNSVVAEQTFSLKTPIVKPSPALKPTGRSAESNTPIDIEAFSITSTVESSAAKDKIRIAPQNRRKPTRFRSEPEKEPADEIAKESASVLAFNQKNEVSKKLFDSVDISNPSICNVKEESQQHSPVATKTVVRSESAEIPKTLMLVSTEDVIRSPPRRTLSTNNKETVPLVPRNLKPRSRPESINSMNNEERLLHSRSLGALNKVSDTKVFLNQDGFRAKSERSLNMETTTREKVECLVSGDSHLQEQKNPNKQIKPSAKDDSDKNSLFLYSLEKDIRSHNANDGISNSKFLQNGSRNDGLIQGRDHFIGSETNDVSSKEDLVGKRNSANYKQSFFSKSNSVDPVRPSDKETSSDKNSLRENREKDDFFVHNTSVETAKVVSQKVSRCTEDISVIHSRNKNNEAGFQLVSPRENLQDLKNKPTEHPHTDVTLELSNISKKAIDPHIDINLEQSRVLKKQSSSEGLNEKSSGKSSFQLNSNELYISSAFDWTSTSIKSDQDKKLKSLPKPKFSESSTEATVPEFNRISLRQTPNSKDLLQNLERSNEVASEPLSPNVINKDDDFSNTYQRFKKSDAIERSLSFHSPLSERQKQAKDVNVNDASIASVDVNIVRSKSLSSAEVKKHTKIRLNPNSTFWSPNEYDKRLNDVKSDSPSKEPIFTGDKSVSLEHSSSSSLEHSSSSELKLKPSSFKIKISNKTDANTSSTTTTSEINTSMPLQHKNSVSVVKNDKCLVCDKTAYKFERCDIDFHVIHNSCAKCDSCSRKLNVSGIHVLNNKIYCSLHKPT